MHILFSRKSLLPLLGLGLAGLLLTPHSASAMGYNPPPPDLTVTNGTAEVSGTGTAAAGEYSFAPGYDASSNSFENGIETNNSSSLLFTGGGAGSVTTRNTSSATLAGGEVENVAAYDDSTVTIKGGHFSNLYTFGNGTINLTGTNLQATSSGASLGGGGFAGNFFVFGYDLSGTLSDGTDVDGYYDLLRSRGGSLQFNGVTAVPIGRIPVNPDPVPEASSVVSLGLMLALGAGGFVIARRKKVGAAV